MLLLSCILGLKSYSGYLLLTGLHCIFHRDDYSFESYQYFCIQLFSIFDHFLCTEFCALVLVLAHPNAQVLLGLLLSSGRGVL